MVGKSKFVDVDMRDDLCREMHIYKIIETGKRKYICEAGSLGVEEKPGPCYRSNRCAFYKPLFSVTQITEQDYEEDVCSNLYDKADEDASL